LTELQQLANDRNLDVIGITETWARPDIVDAEYEIDGYQLYRKDHSTGYGGVMMYVKNDIRSAINDELTVCDFEDSIWCTIEVCNGEKLAVGTIYRSTSSANQNDDRLLELLTKAATSRNKDRLLIMGDFNLPEIDYDKFVVRGDDNSYQQRFFDKTQDLFFVQNVFDETRYRHGQLPSRLDYVFTMNEDEIADLQYMNPLGCSDHVGLSWKYDCSLASCKKNAVGRAYWKADYGEMSRSLKLVDWDDLVKDKSIEETWLLIVAKYEEIVDKYVPETRRSKKKKLTFLSKETKKLINKREKLFRNYTKTGRDIDFDKYKKVRNAVNSAIRKEKLEETNKRCRIYKDNKKAFFGFVRSKQRSSGNALHVRMESGNMTQTPEEAAGELSSYFKSVYTEEDTLLIPSFEPVGLKKPPKMDNIVIQEEEVYKCLKKLKQDKSPGPDNMHPAVLKNLAEDWTKPLTILFQRSVQQGILPQDWKSANVTPIFKKGSRVEVNNYRPVALTSVACKLLETIIRNNVVKHMETNSLFSQQQHGFTRGRSCLTNLLESLEDWTAALEEGCGLDVLYLDYQKAFDTVPHKRLLEKIKWYGISDSLCKWISEFVSNRQMRVVTDGGSSNWNCVKSGVPQGSVLGPLLFVIYVNELPHLLKSKVKMFADDIKLWNVIKKKEDEQLMQEDIKKLEQNSEEWLLKFNVDKCKKLAIRHQTPTQYWLRNEAGTKPMEQISEERDLGVWVTQDLKWSQQCDKAAAKAMSVLGMIKRTFTELSRESFTILYGTYVRPHLEYCSQVWAPYFQKDINVLEKVQRRATKLIPSIRKLRYEDRLKYLGLFSLQRRRKRGDLIETFKIMNGVENIDSETFFKRSSATNLRGHNFKIYKQTATSIHRRNFFSQRVVNSWNLLPWDVVNASSVAVFKKRLDKYMDTMEMGNES